MPTTEHTINDALAAVLRRTRHAWATTDAINSENTGILKNAAKRPDILVSEPNVSPVVIETEVLPATAVEQDALARLGNQLKTTGSVIFSSIAVRLPGRLRKQSGKGLSIELGSMNDLEIALYTGDSPTNWTRWPRSGWISASVSDLSILTQSATVPPEVVDRAANVLIEGVSDAAGLLANIAKTHPGAVHKISEDLKQEDGEQTRRMAATILANAFVFMESLAGGPDDLAPIRSLEAIKSSGGADEGNPSR